MRDRTQYNRSRLLEDLQEDLDDLDDDIEFTPSELRRLLDR